MKNYVITGGTSGLGAKLVERLLYDQYNYVFVTGKEEESRDHVFYHNFRAKYMPFDLRLANQTQIDESFKEFVGDVPIDALINCAGINAIDWFPKLTSGEWEQVMAVNVSSILYISQALLPSISKAAGTIINVVSNAWRMPMTHSWLYNASKGAAAIVTRQMARELQKTHNVCVFGVCPNKMKGTEMSKYIDKRVCELRGWTEEEAAKYQLVGLVPGFETNPDDIAELMVWLLAENRRHKYLSGCLLELGY